MHYYEITELIDKLEKESGRTLVEIEYLEKNGTFRNAKEHNFSTKEVNVLYAIEDRRLFFMIDAVTSDGWLSLIYEGVE